MAFSDYDATPANNTTIAGINIQGTAAVSNFDNALRALMADAKAFDSALPASVASYISGASAKTTPVSADTFAIIDSADSNALKQVSLTNLYTTLKTSYDARYLQLTGGTITGAFATRGLKDNSTTTSLTLTGMNATFSSPASNQVYIIQRGSNEGALFISAGVDQNNGTNVLMYGANAAGAPNGFVIRNNTNNVYHWNGTAGIHTWNAPAGTSKATLDTSGYTLNSAGVLNGTKALGSLSGAVTPVWTSGNFQSGTNAGAITLNAPATISSRSFSIVLRIANGTSSGAITTSGWTKVTGDPFDTTSSSVFLCYITVVDTAKHLHVTKVV